MLSLTSGPQGLKDLFPDSIPKLPLGRAVFALLYFIFVLWGTLSPSSEGW